MGKIASVPAAAAVLFIRTSDHCPPHAHAANAQSGWEIRVFFSYASADLDYNIKWGTPSTSDISECMEEVWAQIEKCREQWWKTFSRVCLDGKPVDVKAGVIRELPAQKPAKTSQTAKSPKSAKGKKTIAAVPAVFLVSTAKYDVSTKSVEFTAQGSASQHKGKCP